MSPTANGRPIRRDRRAPDPTVGEPAAANVTVAGFASWAAVRDRAAVLSLVDQLQSGEPYNYRPGEIPPAGEWFPPLVDRSDCTLVAYTPGERVVGYCVWLALERYAAALGDADQLAVEPSTSRYLAELGVCPTMRRRGVASLLLRHTLRSASEETTAWVVRTLEVNAPAIALYQRHGFELAPHAPEIRHGRPRVYLVRSS